MSVAAEDGAAAAAGVAAVDDIIVRDFAYPNDDPRFSGKHAHAVPEDDIDAGDESDPWSSFGSGGPKAQAGRDPAGGNASLDQARALYDFDAENPTELSFAEGDVLQIIYKQCDGWLVGFKDNHVGLIPENYVQMFGPGDK
ncbi:HOG (high osmolarity glycerol) pathway protein [Coemansia javaensis]|uniref:HOG (High osmolarity glycerol) pathway protein n=1 Tax=Coemansia javaensis TaxID=2761396 RepID=A0A9W8HJJ7_9FUNG|nr:HOG (high osmolarity glycerol) pathway protein [Coemansia javaensis]